MENIAENGWKVVDSEIVIETQHLRLRRDEIELPGGKRIGPYYVRESRGFAVIFALTPERRVVLVRQYKHGIGKTVLELPAGGVDPGETPEACAARELAEETGYVSNVPLEHAGTFVLDPTSSTTLFHLYIAHDARPAHTQRLDETEQIEVQLATLAEVRSYMRDGAIEVGSQVAAIYRAFDRLGLLEFTA